MASAITSYNSDCVWTAWLSFMYVTCIASINSPRILDEYAVSGTAYFIGADTKNCEKLRSSLAATEH